MKFRILLSAALLCTACNSNNKEPKASDAEIEAAILYQQQFSGTVLSFEAENCFYQHYNENHYYKCDVSYRFASQRYGRAFDNTMGMCLKLKSDGVWRHCYAENDYNIVTDNVLTR